jgi:CelD/BcsL family acetyltransferase involved in cellulose biosynthesis
MYKIKLLEGLEDFNNIKRSWEELYKENDNNSHFQSWDWTFLYLKRNLQNGKLKVYLLYKNKNLKVIAPLQLNKRGLFFEYSFISDNTHADYLDFIYAKIDKEDLIYLINYILNNSKLSYLNINSINNENATCKILKEEYGDFYFRIKCVGILIPNTIEDYIKGLGKSTKKEINYKTNKITKNFSSVEYLYLYDKDVSLEIIKKLFIVYKERRLYKFGKEKFTSQYYSFLEDYIYKNQHKFLSLIKIDNNIAAFTLGFISKNRRLEVLIVSIDNQYLKYSVGIILIYRTICELISKRKSINIDYYDLTIGDELYKLKLGGAYHYNFNFSIANKKVIILYFELKKILRKIIKRIRNKFIRVFY